MQKMLGTILMVLAGFGLDSSVSNSCAPRAQRQTVEVLNREAGTIVRAGNDETAVYLISCPSRYLRLHALNLPEQYKKHGLAVTFSGNIKAASTLEDDFGELFEVTDVQPAAVVTATASITQ